MLQVRNKRPTDCEWCGKFIIMVQQSDGNEWRPYEAQRDDEDRLLQAYDGTLIYGFEHHCKARCSICGSPVIVEKGRLFDRIMLEEKSKGLEMRKAHRCQ